LGIWGWNPPSNFSFAEPGNYQVVLTATDYKGCQASTYRSVLVNALPQPNFTYTSVSCDDPTQFTDLSIGGFGTEVIGWRWNFGDVSSGTNNISNNENPSHVYSPIDSTYLVTLSVINHNGCTDSITLPVHKDPCVMSYFGPTTDPLCSGQLVCFKDSSYIFMNAGALVGWKWEFGDGFSSTYTEFQNSICHKYLNPGTYIVNLIVTGDVDGTIIRDTSQVSIFVNPIPTTNFANTAACGNTIIQFTDETEDNGMAISKWHWDFGNPIAVNDTSDQENPVWVYNQQGTYSVELITTNEAGCMDTLNKSLSVFPRPTASFDYLGPCVNNPTNFADFSDTSSIAFLRWAWNFGDTLSTKDTSNLQSPSFSFNRTGIYHVEMVVTDKNLCSDTTFKTIEIFEAPISSFVVDENFEGIQGQVFLDNLSIGASEYFWNFDNGDSSYLEEPVISFKTDGSYEIMLVAYNNKNCADTSYFDYSVFLRGLYIPNAFAPLSPNPDVKSFKPKGYNLKEYLIEIYSGWGDLVWSSTGLDSEGRPLEAWDGTSHGELLPQGAYLWKAKAVFRDNTIWEGSDIGDGNTKTFGTVTLIH
jgi:large repetitive protein